MELQEDVNGTIISCAPVVYGFQQVHGIYRLNHSHVRQHQLQFVGLQMADKMPLHIGGHLRRLGRQLLRAVLAKQALSGIVSLHQAFHRMKLGHGHQTYIGRERRTEGLKCFGSHRLKVQG